MKICIELDEEMKKWWLIAKEGMEETLQNGALTDAEVLKGVLEAWSYGEGLYLLWLRYS